MKTKLFTVLALALTIAMPVLASQTSLTGVLTDDMCTKKHMSPGKSNADCVRECAKHGAKYVVVTGGKVVELHGKQEQLSEFAGQKVKITGNLIGKSLTVSSIEAAQ